MLTLIDNVFGACGLSKLATRGREGRFREIHTFAARIEIRPQVGPTDLYMNVEATIDGILRSGDIDGAASHLEALLRAEKTDRFGSLAGLHFPILVSSYSIT